MPTIRTLDIEQSLLLLELEAPFTQRDVQKQRRQLAKRWHPDVAPPGRQYEHQRHLQAINEAADQLESLAEHSRGGRVSKSAVQASAAAARHARAEAGRRAWEKEQARQAADEERTKHDPYGNRIPDVSVVHRYARCVSYPEWGVGTVTGIYFSGSGDNTREWARISFSVGVRTVPAGSLRYVDFSKPDPGAERMERFLVAAQHALQEGDFQLAAQRLVYARNAEPDNVIVLRMMALAFWQEDNMNAAARAVRDWIRLERDSAAPHRFAARIYEQMGALGMAAEAAERETEAAPLNASGWERLGRLRLRLLDARAAVRPLERARAVGATPEGLLDLALAYHLTGDVGGEVSACAAVVQLVPNSGEAWSRYAHALARTDRPSECVVACERALKLGRDVEVAELLARVKVIQPRVVAQANP